MSAQPTEGTTPRPWKVIVEEERGDYGSILSRYLDRIEGADRRTAVKFFDDYGTDQSADAALIVAAVNDYDRLRAIEAATEVFQCLSGLDLPADRLAGLGIPRGARPAEEERG